jgi:glycosyltransferase involved in cell wall biosynthesis
MRILFVHQNFPGQYRHLAPALADDPDNEVVAIGDQANLHRALGLHPHIRLFAYPSPQGAGAEIHHYLRSTESSVRRGQAVARAVLELKNQGFTPDVICAHPGWGEALFLRDVFPVAKLVLYLEFYYRTQGSDMNFDPEFPTSFDDGCCIRLRNTTQLLSLESADVGISPTHWQRAQYPAMVQDRISVIHDGVNTDIVCPGRVEDFQLPCGGGTLQSGDEVITYVARNLEPYRGIHNFLRALPDVLEARPRAQVLIVGGNEVSYGRAAPGGQTFRSIYMKEVAGRIDASRIHFLGRLPYASYLQVLRLSSVHVYLTYPFVLSWSMLEAMSCGCLLIASSTAPVQEVLQHEYNGLLVDFHAPQSLAKTVIHALKNPQETAPLRQQATLDMQSRFDLTRVCLPQLKAYIQEKSRHSLEVEARSAARSQTA